MGRGVETPLRIFNIQIINLPPPGLHTSDLRDSPEYIQKADERIFTFFTRQEIWLKLG